ncbi:MAG: hypothetical protein JWO72_3039 [Caulobacteraceae bacterium]|nr:hypothetical protein [Caulobacteraceae bacterium]
MRDFKGMKRQRGRNRGGSGAQGGNSGKPQQHNANRSFESNGPDNVKIRGNAQHVFEKYQQLARDASSGGDRVLAENYLQHAEHYFRVVRAVQPNRPVADIIGRDTFSSGYDIDFEDESGAQADPEPSSEAEAAAEGDSSNGNGDQRQDRGEWQGRDRQRDERPREDRNFNRDDRPRDERPREDRPREDRQDRYRDDRPRDERPREVREDRPRDERPRDERPREDRPRDDRPPRRDRFGRERFERGDRPARDPMAVVEPEATPLTSEAPAEEGQRQLRSQDGSLSPAPAFLQARADSPPRAVEAEVGEAKKPRRRRAPRSFEGGEGEAPATPETEEV